MTATSTVSNAPVSKAYLTLAEFAAELDCTTRFLEKRIEDGEIKVFRPSSRLIRIARSECNRWIESYTSTGKATGGVGV